MYLYALLKKKYLFDFKVLKGIVIDMTDNKKPWEDVPVEVLIEIERKKKKKKSNQERPRLHAPLFERYEYPPLDEKESDDYKIVIEI